LKRFSSRARSIVRASTAVTSAFVVASTSKRSLAIHGGPPAIWTSWMP
jgi:hypothetical protein